MTVSEQGEKYEIRRVQALNGGTELYRGNKAYAVFWWHKDALEMRDHLNALEAELEQLRPRAALAERVLTHAVHTPSAAHSICVDGLQAPDALPPSQGEGARKSSGGVE